MIPSLLYDQAIHHTLERYITHGLLVMLVGDTLLHCQLCKILTKIFISYSNNNGDDIVLDIGNKGLTVLCVYWLFIFNQPFVGTAKHTHCCLGVPLIG